MGISPDIWGPSAWKLIHLMILAEPDDMDLSRMKHYQQFFEVLQEILPCGKCRNHLRENLSKLPPIGDLKNKRALFDWSVDLHNLVNKITGKNTWEKEKAYVFWKGISNGEKNIQGETCTRNIWKTIAIVLLITLVIISIYIVFNYEGKELHMKRIFQKKH